MCGISGFCNFDQDYREKKSFWENHLILMQQTLAHRGDNGKAPCLFAHAGLSHAHPGIFDAKGGSQSTMRRQDPDGCAVACNGKIYNTDELIPELTRAGCIFQTSSDAEIIRYAYLHYGADFVSRLNGVFALAIWDETKQSLFLYRDRAGIKPLFYAVKDGTLLFGSEPKALFAYPGFSPAITADSLREILALGPAHTPGCGVFKDVSEVLPGHCLTFTRDGIRQHLYWDLTGRPHTDSYADTVEKVSFLVRDAIRRQMISDAPVCAFLSGGIDSSIVTAVAAARLREHGETLRTFSFDFTENEKYFQSSAFQPERDLPYVRLMAEYLHTDHTCLECDPTTLADALSSAVDAKDLPGMTDVDASLLYFCSLVAKQNKVALTGECADEIFGGYPWFYRRELLGRDGFPWAADMDARTVFLNEDLCASLNLAEYAHTRYEETLARVPLLDGETGETKKRRQVAYLNIKWFMQTLLDRMDRDGMYSGLEGRVPFADHRIMEYVFNVPWEMKYQNGVEKALLRDACADLLPPELLHRKKSPYPKTYHPTYEKRLAERLTALVSDPNAPIAPLIDRKKALAFIASHKELGRPWFGQLMAGPQLMAYFIQINDWMEKYHLSI